MRWPPQRACCRGNVVWGAFRRHQEAILGPCSSIMEWKGGHEPAALLFSKRNMGRNRETSAGLQRKRTRTCQHRGCDDRSRNEAARLVQSTGTPRLGNSPRSKQAPQLLGPEDWDHVSEQSVPPRVSRESLLQPPPLQDQTKISQSKVRIATSPADIPH